MFTMKKPPKKNTTTCLDHISKHQTVANPSISHGNVHLPLNSQEFIGGILRCKGPARAIDQVAMMAASCRQLFRGRVKAEGGGHLSNEKIPGWLGYIGDDSTQVYRDYIKPL